YLFPAPPGREYFKLGPVAAAHNLGRDSKRNVEKAPNLMEGVRVGAGDGTASDHRAIQCAFGFRHAQVMGMTGYRIVRSVCRMLVLQSLRKPMSLTPVTFQRWSGLRLFEVELHYGERSRSRSGDPGRGPAELGGGRVLWPDETRFPVPQAERRSHCVSPA